jgi:hypothetical protein
LNSPAIDYHKSNGVNMSDVMGTWGG